MVDSVYTPFMANIGASIGRGLEKRGLQQQEKEKNKLIQSAYMGQPGALQQLYGVDPQAASQIESQKTQREQTALKTQQSSEDRTREILAANKELVDETLEQAVKLGSIEEAQSYIDSVVAANQELFKDADVGRLTPESFEQIKQVYSKAAAGEGISQVQSSKQLPGGFVQIVRKDGTVDLVEPKEAESELIRQAEERGAELQGLRAGERESAKGSMKEAIDAFKKLTPLRKSIANLDEGIRLIDEGAETGVIASKFPSIKAASIKLDNLQGQLGLDVIGNTTFGALSESELAFALDTALPKKLEGPELKLWLKEKRDSQAKLIDYLNDAAIFLGTPGNSIADFLERQKENQRDGAESVNSSDNDLTPEEQAEYEELKARFSQQ